MTACHKHHLDEFQQTDEIQSIIKNEKWITPDNIVSQNNIINLFVNNNRSIVFFENSALGYIFSSGGHEYHDGLHKRIDSDNNMVKIMLYRNMSINYLNSSIKTLKTNNIITYVLNNLPNKLRIFDFRNNCTVYHCKKIKFPSNIIFINTFVNSPTRNKQAILNMLRIKTFKTLLVLNKTSKNVKYNVEKHLHKINLLKYTTFEVDGNIECIIEKIFSSDDLVYSSDYIAKI